MKWIKLPLAVVHSNHLVGQRFRIKNQVCFGLLLLGKTARKRIHKMVITDVRWYALYINGTTPCGMDKVQLHLVEVTYDSTMNWSMTAQYGKLLQVLWPLNHQSVQQVLEVRNQPFWPQTTVWSFRRIQQISLKYMYFKGYVDPSNKFLIVMAWFEQFIW